MSESFYCVLQFQKGQQIHNIGILLYDARRKKLLTGWLKAFTFTDDEDDYEILADLQNDLTIKALERQDPIWIFEWFEENASNAIQISQRYPVQRDPEAALQQAFEQHLKPL